MQIKTSVENIVEDVKKKSLDSDTFYTHVLDGTIDEYYNQTLEQVSSDLLNISVERAHLNLEPMDPKEDAEQLADAIIEISLDIAHWFLKDPRSVERDFSRTISNLSAEDIREARFLLRNNLLN